MSACYQKNLFPATMWRHDRMIRFGRGKLYAIRYNWTTFSVKTIISRQRKQAEKYIISRLHQLKGHAWQRQRGPLTEMVEDAEGTTDTHDLLLHGFTGSHFPEVLLL